MSDNNPYSVSSAANDANNAPSLRMFWTAVGLLVTAAMVVGYAVSSMYRAFIGIAVFVPGAARPKPAAIGERFEFGAQLSVVAGILFLIGLILIIINRPRHMGSDR